MTTIKDFYKGRIPDMPTEFPYEITFEVELGDGVDIRFIFDDPESYLVFLTLDTSIVKEARDRLDPGEDSIWFQSESVKREKWN